MQRDFDLIVTLLGAFRDADSATLTAQDLATFIQEEEDAEELERVLLHLDLLEDAGLARKVDETGIPEDDTWRITWKGYDALEQDEDDELEDEDDEGGELND